MSIKRRYTARSTHQILDARRQRKYAERHSLLSRTRRVIISIGTVILVLFSAIFLLAGAYAATLRSSLHLVDELAGMIEPEAGKGIPPTQFFDRSGEILFFTLENPGIERRYLSVDPAVEPHFSAQLVKLVYTLEDHYWSGPGISLSHLADPEPYTIAEHLVLDMLLYGEPAGLPRALRMRMLAVEAQNRYGKAKILEWYLNTAFAGHLAYGADQAAQVYLGKSASTLSLAESALLAGVLNEPALNPIDAPQAVREQTISILENLAATGKYSAKDLENAKAVEVSFMDTRQPDEETEFIRYAMKQIKNSIDDRRLERGGMKVITTLDADLQQQLICTIETQLQRISNNPEEGTFSPAQGCEAADMLPLPGNGSGSTPSSLSVSANSLVLDPLHSEILAWSGILAANESDILPDYQAGNLLDPLLAAAAFAGGMSPATLVWDVPETADEINLNPDGTWQGPLSLRQAVARHSANAIYQTARKTGFDNVWTLVNTLGFAGMDRESFEHDLSTGGGRTTLPEIGQAFSTFATLGWQSGLPDETGKTLAPVAVLRVEDYAGNEVYRPKIVEERPVLDGGLAYLVHDVLSTTADSLNMASQSDGQMDTAQSGIANIGRPAAGVVGTAAAGNQVWTVGYTPYHLTVVWMGIPGYGDKTVGEEVQTGWTAGLWQAVMQYAAKEEPSRDWKRPASIVQMQVCYPSGLLPTDACPDVVDELFLSGAEPSAFDTLYQTFQVNSETGNLATLFTPGDLVREQTFFIVPEEYTEWIVLHNIQQPPAAYDPIPVQQPLPGAHITSPASLAYLHGTADITGTAGGDGFVSFRLDYGQGLYPQSWTVIGAESTLPVKEALLGRWDTTGLNGLYLIRLSVQSSHNGVQTAYLPLWVDNNPPEASITWPLDGQAIQNEEGGEVVFLASGTDDVGLDHITWYVDGIASGGSTIEPFFLPWKLSMGSHVLKVAAYDLAGNVTDTPEVEIIVQ